MPIEKWNTVEAAEASLGTRTNLQVAHGEGIALQHTLGGDPMPGRVENAGADNSASAGRYNGSAAYVPPITVRADGREKHCKANRDTCMGWATSTGYCRPHSVS